MTGHTVDPDTRAPRRRRKPEAAKLWWLDRSWTSEWSAEETSVRARILGLSLFFFVLLFIPAGLISDAFGFDSHVSVFVAFAITAPPAFYAGRRMAVQLWPDLVKIADENAAKRLGASSGRC
jgi:hypothetical protein